MTFFFVFINLGRQHDLSVVRCAIELVSRTVLVLDDLVEDNADADQREDACHHIDRR